MKRLVRSLQTTAFIALFLTSNLLLAQSTQVKLAKDFTLTLGDQNSQDISPEIKDMLHYYEKQIYFTQNSGQWPAHVLYKANFTLGQALATKEGMLVGTYSSDDVNRNYERGIQEEEAIRGGQSFDQPRVNIHGHGWLMNFMNHSSNMTISSNGAHKDKFNYFMGATQQSNVSSYQEVWYNNVYDNVDVRYYPSQEGTLEYDIICKPGFNKGLLEIKLDGIENVSINNNGELVIKTSVGEMTYPAPIAYQKINGKKSIG